MSATDTLAVIPVRGGSKGIIRKNLIPIAGKPLVVWTIEQALETPGLRVVVSTEDAELKAVALEAGAEVVDRPSALAQDETATEPVVLHAIEQACLRHQRPDRVMLLQATSPIRRPGTLSRALQQFEEQALESLVGVVPIPPFIWSLDGESVKAHWDWEHRRRRQEMDGAQLRYRETGSLYVTSTYIYEQFGNRLGGRIGLFVMDESEGIDIDTMHDVKLAASLLIR